MEWDVTVVCHVQKAEWRKEEGSYRWSDKQKHDAMSNTMHGDNKWGKGCISVTYLQN